MADEKVIAASVQIDTDAATKNMLKLKGTVEDLKKEFKNAAAGSDEQLAALKKLTAAEEELAKAQKGLADSSQQNVGAFSKIKGSLSELPGVAGAASKGVSGLSATFKALLANPVVLVITAIVGALTLLYKAFTATDSGAQKVQSVLDGLGAVIRELADRVLNFGSAILKFFTGDFKGAIEDGTKAVSGFGDAMVDSFNRGKEASDLLDEVADAVRVLDIQYAALNAKLAKSKEILTDENATFEEKRQALKESAVEIDKYYKKKAENDEKELSAIAKKYNIEAQLNELRKQGYEEGAENFDNFLQNLAIGEDGIKEIEDSIKKTIESGAELSAKQRQQNKAEATLQRQEDAKRKEERQKAAEEEKRRRQELVEFTNKLTKLQQDNELALIKDSYQKELKQLENRIADEKRQNELAFKDKKISQEQLIQLNTALNIQENIQRAAINDKHNEELKKKEAEFQKELADITGKGRVAAIKDSRQAELVQLEIGYQEKLKQAIEKYKDDSAKLEQIKAAIDEQYRAEKAAKEAKIKEEEDKKKLETAISEQEKIIKEDDYNFELKKAAVDKEKELYDEAFKNKLISEADYNSHVSELSEKRKKITELETAHRKAQAEEVTGILGKLADIVGRQTVAGKALGIATALINTWQGASEALKQKSTLPSPFDVIAKVANVATVVAAGLKTVKEIAKVQVPGGSGSASVPAAPAIEAPAAPLAPTQTSTSLDQGTINNIGNAAAGGVNSIRAYVVEQDSAAAAARAARLQGAAVLGG
jgi:hypothetical protein